jgi:hypothetical protein
VTDRILGNDRHFLSTNSHAICCATAMLFSAMNSAGKCETWHPRSPVHTAIPLAAGVRRTGHWFHSARMPGSFACVQPDFAASNPRFLFRLLPAISNAPVFAQRFARTAADSASGTGASCGGAAGGRATSPVRTTSRLKSSIAHALRPSKSFTSGPEVRSRASAPALSFEQRNKCRNRARMSAEKNRWLLGQTAFSLGTDTVKQTQQQSFAVRFLRRQVFLDNRYIGEPFTKRAGQAVEGLRNECLEPASLHVISDL